MNLALFFRPFVCLSVCLLEMQNLGNGLLVFSDFLLEGRDT